MTENYMDLTGEKMGYTRRLMDLARRIMDGLLGARIKAARRRSMVTVRWVVNVLVVAFAAGVVMFTIYVSRSICFKSVL
jgi:hypothetical protein